MGATSSRAACPAATALRSCRSSAVLGHASALHRAALAWMMSACGFVGGCTAAIGRRTPPSTYPLHHASSTAGIRDASTVGRALVADAAGICALTVYHLRRTWRRLLARCGWWLSRMSVLRTGRHSEHAPSRQATKCADSCRVGKHLQTSRDQPVR